MPGQVWCVNIAARHDHIKILNYPAYLGQSMKRLYDTQQKSFGLQS